MFVKVRKRGRKSRNWVGTVFTELGKVVTTGIVSPPRGCCHEGAVYPTGDRVFFTECKHPKEAHVIKSTKPWSVPITENRAAHGNITDKVECLKCGAYRYEEINGTHIGEGPWLVPQLVLDAMEKYDRLYQEIMDITEDITSIRRRIKDRYAFESHHDCDRLAELEKTLREKQHAIRQMRI